MTISVYRIRNVHTGRYYVGSSQETERRLARHLRELTNGAHHCPFLQRAWHKHGSEAFVFELVETFSSVEEARWLEQRILDEEEYLYNTSRMASGGDLISYHPDRDKILAKMTSHVREWMASLSEEERCSKFGRSGELNGMYGRAHSEEAREKMRGPRPSISLALTGREFSQQHRQALSEAAKRRTGEKNPFSGRSHSSETKAKVSEKNKALIPPNATAFIVDSVLYRSKSEAARYLGVSTPTILHRTKSSNPAFSGYRVYDPEVDSAIEWPTPDSLGLTPVAREVVPRGQNGERTHSDQSKRLMSKNRRPK